MDDAQFLEELKKDFFEEAQTLIESLEANILIVEKEPTNEEAINEIFRAAHTLKGGSSTLDLDRIAQFTHEMENLLDEVRSGNIKLTSDIIDVLLKSIDIVKNLLAASHEDREQPPGYEDEIIKAIKNFAEGGQVQQQAAPQAEEPTQPKKKLELVFNEYERYLIKNAYNEGHTVYEVYVVLNKNNPMKTVSGLQIHSQLKEIADILKSAPDIDDLMSDQFYEEVVFIIQSNLTASDIHQKVFISDVTDFVEINEFKEDIEEEAEQLKKSENKLIISEEDQIQIISHLQTDKRVFKINVLFDDENPMRSVSGVLFYTMLRTRGDILKSLPSYEDFKKDTFYPRGEFILITDCSVEELKQKLYLSDVTKELKFQEFKKPDSQEAPAQAPAPPKIDTPAQIKEQEPPMAQPSPEPVVDAVAFSAPTKTSSIETVVQPTVKPINLPKPAQAQPAPASVPDGPEKDKRQLTSVLRVESSRIDDMLNLVGELVIIKASFTQSNDDGARLLEEFIGSVNNFKGIIRQYEGEINELIEKSGGNGSANSKNMMTTESPNAKRGEFNLTKFKEEFKEKIDVITNHFDSLLPQYRVVQEKLKSSSQNLTRITDDLQESVMKVRMVPVNQIFSRFPRLVRDISKNLKKDINLQMYGEDTELDKSVIEDLVDPLIHIVRNAVDHGIEPPEERKQTSKNPTGTIELRAEHEGNTVVITIQDDGRGLNLEKIKQKAITNKLIEPNQEISETELINLIFHAGFSTATEVTSLSGRGVGMDVVRKKIENIGGVVEIESEQSKGSRFSIKIPLTLAIIQALLVQVSDYVYSIPINSVIETLRIGPEDIEVLENTEVIRVREEILSLIQLDRLFKHRHTPREDEFFYVIVVGISGKKVALGVDNLVGEQDVVIKPLNNRYTSVPGIAGATILGDGQVSLVLDVGGIFSLIANQRKQLYSMK